MKGFQKTNPYKWSLIDKTKYVFWVGDNKSFKPCDYKINKSYSSKPGVRSAEEHLRIMNGKTAVVGRMVVIHENRDDLGLGTGSLRKESLLTGNAGKRLACGIIGLTN